MYITFLWISKTPNPKKQPPGPLLKEKGLPPHRIVEASGGYQPWKFRRGQGIGTTNQSEGKAEGDGWDGSSRGGGFPRGRDGWGWGWLKVGKTGWLKVGGMVGWKEVESECDSMGCFENSKAWYRLQRSNRVADAKRSTFGNERYSLENEDFESHGGVWKMIFLFNWIFKFPAVSFQGCAPRNKRGRISILSSSFLHLDSGSVALVLNNISSFPAWNIHFSTLQFSLSQAAGKSTRLPIGHSSTRMVDFLLQGLVHRSLYQFGIIYPPGYPTYPTYPIQRHKLESMILLFQWWDMLVSWRVTRRSSFLHKSLRFQGR